MLAIVGAVILVPCVCCGGIGIFVGRGIYIAATEREDVQGVVDLYMQNMRNKAVEQAYALFSSRARRQVPTNQLQQAVDGPSYAMFADYERATVTFISVSTSAHSDQNQPQGTVANVSGTVSYAGGVQGTFRATLEREEGQWRLHNINVTVPPAKVNAEGK